ncbi:MAG: hypothetical protein KAI71_05400 [Candidatus Pacebacteria bacterium]|nr:hypothetical protein [Candidatus Paceibacterota bacterium]
MNGNIVQVQAVINKNKEAKKIIRLLLKNEYGLYQSDVIRKLKISQTIMRGQIIILDELNVFDSKSVYSKSLKGGIKGTFIYLEKGIRIINTDNSTEISTGDRYSWKEKDRRIIVDHDGFRIPVRAGKGTAKTKMFKIKYELLKAMSETL